MDTDLRSNNTEDNEQTEAVRHSLLCNKGECRTHTHKRNDDGEAANAKIGVEAGQYYLDQSEPRKQDRPESNIHKATNWKIVAAILHDALHEINEAFNQANLPITSRSLKAFDIVRDTMLEVSDWKTFFLSEARGKIQIIINDWYRKQYGKTPEEDEGAFFSALLIRGMPFILRVPKIFKIAADEPNTIWIGFPASVQEEEKPLNWIQNKDVVGGLSGDDLDNVKKLALETANLVRSIDFDTRSLLEQDDDLSIFQLASSVRTDIQSSAKNLCGRDEAALRSAAWDASQATEKALKILIRRHGRIPPNSHNLPLLAQKAERLGAQAIDPALLKRIPSGKDAPNLRYGGEITLIETTKAYSAALSIIRQITFEAKPDSKYNTREARFKLKLPPWFNFDIPKFRQRLHQFESQ